MTISGTVVNWNTDKGFGFIKSADGSEIFAHISDVQTRIDGSYIGHQVSYTLSQDKDGRRCAANIKLFNYRAPKTSTPTNLLALTVAVLFLCAIGLPIYLQEYPIEIGYLYGVMGLLSFLLYAKDKSAAQSGRWRVNEDTLHLISLLGGWPGAIFAQQWLRHKTVKRSFRRIFWLTVLINSGFIAWTFTRNGDYFLYSTIFDMMDYVEQVTPIINRAKYELGI